MLNVTTRIGRSGPEGSDRCKGPQAAAKIARTPASNTRTRDMASIMRVDRPSSNVRRATILAVTAISLGAARDAAAQAGRASAPLPARDVDDPGVVATGQRITPAGLQMVVPGRVGGVRFGSGNELWVVAAGAAYRLEWSAGRVLARVGFRGRAGVGGVAIDPKNGRAFVATIGPINEDTTIAPLSGAPARATLVRGERAGLLAIAPDATGDSAHATQ